VAVSLWPGLCGASLRGAQSDWHCGLVDRVSARRIDRRRLANDISGCGGWLDYVATLAKTYPLDLDRVIAMGHSSGAQLAFWLAGRHHIPATSRIYEPSQG
jgi:pimeloyl-ACP methyl ester carboxylesterase